MGCAGGFVGGWPESVCVILSGLDSEHEQVSCALTWLCHFVEAGVIHLSLVKLILIYSEHE